MTGKQSKTARPRPLSADRIVTEALALVDAEGLEGFSFRILARRLGCEAMSLYHYFPGKTHLFDAMLDSCIAELRLPESTLPWDEKLLTIAREMRALALHHPGFFPFLAVHRLNTYAGLKLLDTMLQVFAESGLDAETNARSFRAFGYYLMGAGLDEATGYSKGPSAAEPVPDAVVARDFPAVIAASPYFAKAHHEATFEHGLRALMQDIRKLAAQSRTGTV